MSNFVQIFVHQSASRSLIANVIEAAYSLIINAYAVPSIVVLRRRPCSFLGAADDSKASKAMTHSSRRERRTKAIAEVLAMIDDAHPELAPDRPDSDREADEWLWDIATGFCAVADRYAERAARMNRQNRLNRPAASPVVTPAARGPSVATKIGSGAFASSGHASLFCRPAGTFET